ncbi:MAG TPA: hypothetical protein VJ750_03340 [Rhizomicrobium sp.]|nr:hypothetical protein [Rhizomicrobium sp.]
MKLRAALMAFFFAAGPAAAQQAVCANGQPCPNNEPVPFPVINPAKGLNDILTYPAQAQSPAATSAHPGLCPGCDAAAGSAAFPLRMRAAL